MLDSLECWWSVAIYIVPVHVATYSCVRVHTCNPSQQHHRRQIFVDRNELHFDTDEHSVLDEEPLNSAEYARRSRPFTIDKGVGGRRD